MKKIKLALKLCLAAVAVAGAFFNPPSAHANALNAYGTSPTITFGTGTTSATITEKMRITAGGLVGIGTISPDSPLTISGTTGPLFHIRADNYGSDFVIGGVNVGTGAAISLYSGGGDDLCIGADTKECGMFLSSGGAYARIGINNVTPTTAFDISGTLRIADSGETCTAATAGAIRYNSGTFSTCNGTAWSALGSGGGGGGSTSSTMIDGWPDAIACIENADPTHTFLLHNTQLSSTGAVYRLIWNGNTTVYAINFTAAGAYSGNSNMGGYDCVTAAKSISTLYAQGKAFNFLGGSGTSSTALGDRLTSGTLAVTANSATSVVSLSTASTTWGYLGSNGSYLPKLNTDNISLSTINGISVSALGGGSASPTNVPAFRVTKGGTDQTIATSTATKLTWSTKVYDTYNSFNTATGRFQPTIAGYYLIYLNVGCNGTLTSGQACSPILYKNGLNLSGSASRSTAGQIYVGVSDIVYLNGTTDYIEAYGYNEGSSASIMGSQTQTWFTGSLIASGNGLISGTTGGGLGDVLTSGTLAVTANSATSVVSLSTAGTTWGYLGSNGSYLPNLNTTNISASTINGISISALGGGASPTNVPSFRSLMATDQTVTANTWTKVAFNSKQFDTFSNFNASTYRFQPAIAGNYIFTANLFCNASICYTQFYKNGVATGAEGGANATGAQVASIATILPMNGTTDYVEAYGYTNTTTFMSSLSTFSGSLLASGNGTISGTGSGVSAMASLTDVTLSSPVSNSILVYDGTKWVNKFLQDTVSTTSMATGWPDGLICTMGGSADTRVFLLTFAPATADGRYYYRSIEQGTNAYTQVGFNANGSYYNFGTNAGYTSAGNCAQSITTLYSTGNAFNFIGGSGSASSGYGLTSGTLGLTLNSPTSIISLSTAGTTWGYLGSTASYLPYLNSLGVSTTNISASTINGVSISALGGSASPTNVPAFSVHKNGTNQTVTASTVALLTWSTKLFDTFSNFDLGTSRYTPTVPGRYIFNLNGWCSTSTNACNMSIQKNGTNIASGYNSGTNQLANTTVIVDMNGTTDYVQATGTNYGGTVIDGGVNVTNFSGSLLASGNGTISGTGSGVSAMASLTDVTLSSPVSNSILVYNGTKWVNTFLQNTVSTSTMVAGWPDAIQCVLGGSTNTHTLYLAYGPASTGTYYYRGLEDNVVGGAVKTQVIYNSNGTFNSFGTSNASLTSAGNCATSINSLYASGQAFNFIGGSAAAASGYGLTSGTLGLTLNSPTSIISLSTAGTTWGYFGSTASYLPYLNSLGVSTTNISVSTINGVSVSALGGGASPTNVPAFRAVLSGSQTLTASVYTKLLFNTKVFDTYNNFNTSTNRYTPTVAGNYIFQASAFCPNANNSQACGVSILKNGSSIGVGLTRTQNYNTSANASAIIPMNGSTDYIEVQGYSEGSPAVIDGTTYYTYFQGSLLASGNGLISGTGAGVSAMSSLTDVTLSSPVSNNILVYDGTKWVNKFLQDTVSTTTMVTSWPDAIICNATSGGTDIYFNSGYRTATNRIIYFPVWDDTTGAYGMQFNATTGAYITGSANFVGTCANKSISQLYSTGQAFNFVGGSGSANSGYGLTSGTLGLTLNSPTSIISLSTAGTTWGYMGSTASYLPNLSSNGISTTNISLSTINGISISALGGSASPTNVPAFRATMSTNPTLTTSTATKLPFNTVTYDTYSSFNTSTNRFIPTVAGYYWISLTVNCANTTSAQACQANINRNGTTMGFNQTRAGGGNVATTTMALVYLNGSTDYVEGWAYSEATTATISNSGTVFAGALIASGNGLVSGTGAGVSAMASLTDVTLSSPVSNSILVYNGTNWINKFLQDTVSTTTMNLNFPDAISCRKDSSSDYITMYYTFTYTSGAVLYRFLADPSSTSDYRITFNADGSYNAGSSGISGYADCGKSISAFYAAGRAYNFIGGTGSANSSYGLTSGTLGLTLNSPTSIISLSTAGTTWGYLGSTGSYLPKLNTDNISVSTINGISVSALGGSVSVSGSSSATVAFSVNKNGTTQTVTANTPTKLTFSNEVFDTNNNYDTGTSRFIPTVAGKYFITLSAYCPTASPLYCQVFIYKNGASVQSGHARSPSGTGDVMATINAVVDMNGSTDYIEAYAQNGGGTSISGVNNLTRFDGFLINGGSSGTGAGVSAMSSLTDVTLSSPVSNSILVYNGTNWINKLLQDTISTTTIYTNWPDAIVCAGTDATVTLLPFYTNASLHYYRVGGTDAQLQIIYNNNGTYNTAAQPASLLTNCLNKSISQLYADGQAFNFIGGSGATSNGYGLTSGTLGLTLNSPTSTVSLTTGGTTWGYLGSTASYLPNLSSNAISTTNISVSTINGVSISALGGSASPTNVPAFRVTKNGTAQSGVASTSWTKVTFSTKDFDTFSNFNTSTSRFQPTVAGNYIVTGSIACITGTATSCFVGIFKNGSVVTQNGIQVSTNAVAPGTSTVLYLNGTTDYIELYAYMAGSSGIDGSIQNTYFSGSLVASGNGSVSGTGAGVSAMASLTDVTLSSPTSNSILVYDGSKWVNKYLANTVSTTTMYTGYPDAISCARTDGGYNLFYLLNTNVSGNVMYAAAYTTNGWTLSFDRTTGVYAASAGTSIATYISAASGQCLNASTSLNQLYTSGQAFNFIGNNDANGIKDRITSGTTGMYAYTDSSASIATGGVERLVVGAAGGLGLNQQPVSSTSFNISGTTIQLTNNATASTSVGSIGITVAGGASAGFTVFPDTYSSTWATSNTVELAAFISASSLQFRTSAGAATPGGYKPFIWKMGSSGAIEVARMTSSTFAMDGEIQPGSSGNSCTATNAGAIRYASGTLTFCNGTAWSSIGSGGSVSATNVPAFRVTKSANQTVTASTWTKLTFNTVDFDNYSNFSTSTSRFTPSVAGAYQLNTSTYCGSGATQCAIALYLNGTLLNYAQAMNAGLPSLSLVKNLTTSDYIEVYVYSGGSTSITGTSTQFSGALLAAGNSSGGAGVSAMSSLTDVTLSSPVSNSILLYDGSKWVNKFLQDTVSTTTIVPSWPDAITCSGTAGNIVLTLSSITSSGLHYYTYGDANTYNVIFTNTGAFSSAGGPTWTSSCSSKTISQLYASGQAFNFIGSTDASGIKDRIVSGTTGLYAYTDSSATIATGGVERIVVGTNNGVGINIQPAGPGLTVSGSSIDVYTSSNDSSGAALGFYKSRNGAAVQLNDRLMGLYGRGYNGTAYSGNVAAVEALAAENFTASANGTYLQFGTTPVGGTSRLARMIINPAGYVGIGKTPTSELDVSGSIQYTGTLTDVSDRRMKTSIEKLPMLSAVQLLSQLTPVQFEMKTKPGTKEWGFIAQDVEKVMPLLVKTLNDPSQTKTLNYMGLIPVLVKSTQELAEENAQLKARVETLEQRVDRLEKLIQSQAR